MHEPPPTYPFTYSWGLRTRAPIIAPRFNGYALLAFAAVLLFVALGPARSDPLRWVFVGVAAGVALGGVGILLQPRGAHKPAQRLIRVHRDRIEFRHAPAAVSFLRTEVIEHYDCPLADLKAIEYFRVLGDASLRLWTPRGVFTITVKHGVGKLRELHTAIHNLTGPRPPALLASTWTKIALACFTAAWIIALLWSMFV